MLINRRHNLDYMYGYFVYTCTLYIGLMAVTFINKFFNSITFYLKMSLKVLSA